MPNPILDPVVLERTDRNLTPDPHVRVQVVTERTTVKYGRRADGSIALTRTVAHHHAGRARWDSEKTFSRWGLHEVVSITARPGEPWLVRCRGPRNRWTSVHHFADSPAARRYPMGPGLLHDLRDRFDLLPAPPLMADYYPLLRHYTPNSGRRLTVPTQVLSQWGPAEFRRAFAGTATAQDLTVRLFGKTRYRRDLVKAVARADLDTLCWAWYFRGLVPVDWLVALLRRGVRERQPHGPSTLRSWYRIRPHLQTMDQQSLKNLLHEDHPEGYLVKDITRLPVPVRPPGRVRSWDELHDVVVQQANLYGPKGRPRRSIALPEPARGWDDSTTPAGRRIVLARHEDTLWDWGRQMNHCIGGYGQPMRSKRSLLGGVYEGDRLIGNFEAQRVPLSQGEGYRLTQLLGKHNQLLPAEAHGDVTGHLVDLGVDVPGRHLGAPRHERFAAA